MNKRKVILSFVFILCVCCMSIFLRHNKESDVGHRLQYWYEKLELEKTYGTLSGEGIKVAIIDAGVDFTHPDLVESDYKDVGFYVENNNDKSHGTMIAGIIGSKAHCEKGIRGIAPNSTIISFDIMDDDQNSDIKLLIEAIERAIEEDVEIINMSIGFSEYYEELEAVVEEAYQKGIILVASAGNEDGKILYPAKFDQVICVGAADRIGTPIYDYSALDILVVYTYGLDIVSTFSDPKEHDTDYISATGSSYSTAIITGLIALIKEQESDITNENIKFIFEKKGKILSYFDIGI